MKLTRTRLLGLVLVTTYAVAWVPLLVMLRQGFDVNAEKGRALAVFQTFAPLVGALVGQAVIARDGPIARPLGLVLDVNRFWLVAWLSPLLVAIVGLATTYLAGVEPILDTATLRQAHPEGPVQSPYSLLTNALLGGVVNVVPALAAELGLRGFLYREMPGGFFARATRIGLCHALLLLPMTALGWGFPEHRWAGVALLLPQTLLFGYAALYLRARSESVIPVALFHGTFVAITSPCITLTPGAADWLRPPRGLAGCVGLLVLLALFALHDRFGARAKLMFPPKPAPSPV